MKHRMLMGVLFVTVPWVGVFISSPPARAAIVPFTEAFTQGSSNWYNGPGVAPLDWSSSGGPDNSAFATTTGSFAGLRTNDPLVLFRAQDEFNSSDRRFVGNWVADGVNGFSATVRHDAGAPLNFFVRFADPANFPGAVSVIPAPVPSGQWTEISFPIPDPNFVYEGQPFPDVFDNIGHVQIGVSTPAGLAGTGGTFTFDLDNVGIVPEPTSLALLFLGVCAVGRRVAHRRLGSV